MCAVLLCKCCSMQPSFPYYDSAVQPETPLLVLYSACTHCVDLVSASAATCVQIDNEVKEIHWFVLHIRPSGVYSRPGMP